MSSYDYPVNIKEHYITLVTPVQSAYMYIYVLDIYIVIMDSPVEQSDLVHPPE